MASFRRSSRGGAFRSVLGFTFTHWRRQPGRLTVIMMAVLLSTLADVLTPLYSGRLVDAVASGAASDLAIWNTAVAAFVTLVALALGTIVLRHIAFMGIIDLTLKMMSDIAADAFHRVQRFSTDWHANNFAGSTVRKITRGMWALDLLNDTILVALLPSIVMLVGSTILLGWYWPMMGVIVAVGSLVYIGLTVALSLSYVAPAASLANAWDTKLGGSLADAVSCSSVVKAFGAEAREDTRFANVVAKWRGRTRRTWVRGTVNGTTQGTTLLLLRTAIIGFALLLWSGGQASAGDITFVLTSFFLLQGYLRDVGMHIRNLQRSVNDMEELVDIQAQPLGVADSSDALPIRIRKGGIRFENVTFHYGSHLLPLYRDFSVSIRPGERVGLVGHSGSGKTTFVKLIQRLYDVNGGRILIDGQDIAHAAQASLRSQIAIVQQEPILFHRSLAENIAYARPGASQAEIEHAAKQASAHDFIMRLPKGYGTLVGERGVKLSGGERQRVAIARAFLANAPILILDEATSSLDSESEQLIQKAMERLMVGRTTLVIAHRLSTVKSLDRLLVFDRGRIAEEGRHEELIKLEGGIYRRLFERQALELVSGLVS
ncbi:ABC transporter ATP-binding protein [Mesorhizobium sp. BAC0120]|uniref:ABC transporter ATP-binding protein n=1 Tax=Mesorhizobium sp. BAC0120 TaxID=3090670 RepID=UPI00298C5CFC|nr:ABC transporter ATP-binding protein [Mesorhizobium sp. BAC0120]MDW6023734.1 ABC transporter ATP-binding protein [Mesorhizobium sp. BAC0120]